MIIRFIAVSLFSVCIAVCVSILWPYLTVSPRPFILHRVHGSVAGVPFVSTAEAFLGSVIPQNSTDNFGSVAGAAASALVESVGETAKEMAVTEALEKVLEQWDRVPEDKKIQIQNKICQ